MKKLIAIGLILSVFILPDQLLAADVTEEWVARYDGVGNSLDYARDIAVDDSGNVYVTGESYGDGTDYDYATVKYDANGNELWVRRYNGPGNYWDRAYAIAVDDLCNVYVIGYSYDSGTSYDYTTVKYDTNGNELWTTKYNGLGNSQDYAYAIALDDSGNVYVTGNSYDSAAYLDYATIKYDSAGNEVWVARYNGPANSLDRAHAIAVDTSGNVYVTGNSWDDDTCLDYATIKYSQHNTPAGNNVVFHDPQTATTITFNTVEQAGDTTVTLTDITEGPPPPSGLKLLPLDTYYDINTTALYSGMVHIAIEYDDTGLTDGQEMTLKLRLYEEATDEWINITTGLDTVKNILYGETDHLALFAVTMGVVTSVDIKPDTIRLKGKKRKGKHITCYIEVYDGYDASNIGTSERLTLSRGEESILSESKYMKLGDHDKDGIPDLKVKFKERDVREMLSPGYIQLTVSGTLILDEEGHTVGFEATDIIHIIEKGKKPKKK